MAKQAVAQCTPKRKSARAPGAPTAPSKSPYQGDLPENMRGSNVRAWRVNPVTDPLAYGLKCQGDCMAPEVCDGDVVICSPAVKVEKGMIVCISFKGPAQGRIKRLASDLFPPPAERDEVEHMLTVEMNNPRTKLFVRTSLIYLVHACVGVYRGDRYIPITPKVPS